MLNPGKNGSSYFFHIPAEISRFLEFVNLANQERGRYLIETGPYIVAVCFLGGGAFLNRGVL